MKFDWRQSIGKSGERKLEALIEDELKFTYRKVGPPDIGVDGEIEIADANRRSTGGLLAVQVKATESSLKERQAFRIVFDEAHLDYFSSLVLTPILAVVSLPDDMIWWKPILHKSNYKGPKGGYGVKFHATYNRLTKKSAPLLSMLGGRSNAILAKYIIEEAEDHLNEMDEQHDASNWDLVDAGVWGQTLASMIMKLRDANCLLTYERRHSEEIHGVERQYLAIVDRVSEWKNFFKTHDEEELFKAHLSDDDI